MGASKWNTKNHTVALACVLAACDGATLNRGGDPGWAPDGGTIPRVDGDGSSGAGASGNAPGAMGAGGTTRDAMSVAPLDAAGVRPDAHDVGANGIRHPGLLSSRADLEAIKRHITDGANPWGKELEHLKARVAGSTLRTPPRNRQVYCGSYNRDPQGNKILECDYAVENGIDAYTFALLGYLVANTAYSDKAIHYIMEWADNFQGFDLAGSNALLQSGWTAPWYANAAEILRYTYLGWTADHTRRTSTFLKVLLPQVSDETKGSPANWLHSRIEAHMAIAIFLDDPGMVTKAAAQWKANTPSYFYIASDRQVPPAPNRALTAASIATLWDTPTYVPGMTMETCRDLGHQGLGVRSIFNTLEMSKVQGIDLLTGNDIRERLTTFLEEQAKWMVSKQDPVGACNEPIVVQPDTLPSHVPSHMDAATPVPYELGYNLLRTPANPLPNARGAIVAVPSTSAVRWVTKWETLCFHVEP